jgi:hypothetical protein
VGVDVKDISSVSDNSIKPVIGYTIYFLGPWVFFALLAPAASVENELLFAPAQIQKSDNR